TSVRRRSVTSPVRRKKPTRPASPRKRRGSKTNPRFDPNAAIDASRVGHSHLHAQSGAGTMDMRPLHDRIIVRRLEEGEQTSGRIIIPDTAKEKPQKGRVIAAGGGKVNDEGKRIPLDIKKGDLILF